MKAEQRISLERVQQLLRYDPVTGHFFWRTRYRNRQPGDRAGTTVGRGYIGINVDGARLRAHRIAWLIRTGQWPTNVVDHIDGNVANNAIANLREATHRQNMQNRMASGYYYTHEIPAKPYMVRILVDGKRKYIGRFATEVEAAEAYRSATIKHFGRFSAAYREIKAADQRGGTRRSAATRHTGQCVKSKRGDQPS